MPVASSELKKLRAQVDELSLRNQAMFSCYRRAVQAVVNIQDRFVAGQDPRTLIHDEVAKCFRDIDAATLPSSEHVHHARCWRKGCSYIAVPDVPCNKCGHIHKQTAYEAHGAGYPFSLAEEGDEGKPAEKENS